MVEYKNILIEKEQPNLLFKDEVFVTRDFDKRIIGEAKIYKKENGFLYADLKLNSNDSYTGYYPAIGYRTFHGAPETGEITEIGLCKAKNVDETIPALGNQN